MKTKSVNMTQQEKEHNLLVRILQDVNEQSPSFAYDDLDDAYVLDDIRCIPPIMLDVDDIETIKNLAKEENTDLSYFTDLLK